MSQTQKNLEQKPEKLITYRGGKEEEEDFMVFKSDKERLKYMRTSGYNQMSISQAFSTYYNATISKELKKSSDINNPVNIEVGQILKGKVVSMTKDGIVFSVPGVKDEVVCKEPFGDSLANIQQYLLTHKNELSFEVREKRKGTYIVSVTSAYYKEWIDRVNKAIQREDGMNVHVDQLVTGGYICSTPIQHLNEVTGQNYTHSVFVPGSHIVLNIEHNFEKWVGQDIVIVPQKFVEFKKSGNMNNESSLVGSRKRVLQILGTHNLYDLWSKQQLAKKHNSDYNPEPMNGTVTGVINSRNKTGVFVEIDELFITGLVPVDASELLDYKPGQNVRVKIKDFDIQEGKEPFIFSRRGNKIIKTFCRPVLEIV